MEGILTMSRKEVERIKILEKIGSREISTKEGAEILGISQRQIYRIKRRIKEEGTEGIIHKLRGRKSNRGYGEELERKSNKDIL